MRNTRPSTSSTAAGRKQLKHGKNVSRRGSSMRYTGGWVVGRKQQVQSTPVPVQGEVAGRHGVLAPPTITITITLHLHPNTSAPALSGVEAPEVTPMVMGPSGSQFWVSTSSPCASLWVICRWAGVRASREWGWWPQSTHTHPKSYSTRCGCLLTPGPGLCPPTSRSPGAHAPCWRTHPRAPQSRPRRRGCPSSRQSPAGI